MIKNKAKVDRMSTISTQIGKNFTDLSTCASWVLGLVLEKIDDMSKRVSLSLLIRCVIGSLRVAYRMLMVPKLLNQIK